MKRNGSKCTRTFSVESSGLKGLDEGLQEAVDLVNDFDSQLKREPSTGESKMLVCEKVCSTVFTRVTGNVFTLLGTCYDV